MELGPQGIRVACFRSAGSPEAPGVDAAFHLHAKNAGVSRAAWETTIADRTMLKRLPSLSEVANAAVLIASDRASAITASVVNLTCGELAD
jgi:3-oxoacyl-[acyl-carrier protein] reductase